MIDHYSFYTETLCRQKQTPQTKTLKDYRMKLRILLEDSWQREFAHLAADSG
ncbi:MAG: hypothetical protein ACR2PV_05720 [Gammaproteobacteria bacterium]